MADLVQANEFVFTPSAFICAFIEQESDTETTTETNVFGAVDKSISPQDVDPLIKRSAFKLYPSGVGSGIFDELGSDRQRTGPGVPGDEFSGASEKLFARIDGTFNTETGTTITIANTAASLTPANPNLAGNPLDGINISSGIQDVGNAIQLTGDITNLVGVNETSQARTDTKTITKTKGAQDTVVLVLTYGQFRSQCANPQATVNAIYNQVLAYFNSL